MELTCPNCNACFRVPDDALGTDGRKVRCSVCAHIWFQEPIEDEIANIAPDPAQRSKSFEDELFAVHSEEEERPEKPKKEKIPLKERMMRVFTPVSALWQKLFQKAPRLSAKMMAFLGGFVLFLALSMVVFAKYRHEILLSVPSFYNIYKGFGYDDVIAPGKDLVFSDTKSLWKHDDDGKAQLHIVTKITNIGEGVRSVPPLKYTVILRDGNKGEHFIYDHELPPMQPLEEREVDYKVPSWPRRGGRDVLVNFALEELTMSPDLPSATGTVSETGTEEQSQSQDNAKTQDKGDH